MGSARSSRRLRGTVALCSLFMIGISGYLLLSQTSRHQPHSSGTAQQQQQQQQQQQLAKHDAKPGSQGQHTRQPLPQGRTAVQGCQVLSRELVASVAKGNTVMLTVGDWRIFQRMGVNWLKHLQAVYVDYYLVGATDKKTADFISTQAQHSSNCFRFYEDGQQGAKSEYIYGDAHYNAATWRKVMVVQQLVVDWGFNVIHSDTDVVWFRDPLPYFLGPHLKAADVALSTDLVSTGNEKGDEGLEVHFHPHLNVNTGVYFVKATPGGKEFMQQWAAVHKTRSHENDQVGLYTWMRNPKLSISLVHKERHMEVRVPPEAGQSGAHVPIHLSLLGVHMLMNGYTYYIPQLHKHQEVQPLGAHMTWLPLSPEGKLARMRDGMLYHDAPDYYAEPMYITAGHHTCMTVLIVPMTSGMPQTSNKGLDADLEHPVAPAGYNKQQDTEAMISFHLHAMDMQLKQMYRVMAVALLLNRTLVLPKMKCFCYKNWFMTEQCRIPGDKASQFPLDCTLDQWLRPKVLYNYGANIVGRDGTHTFMFREHSLFDHPLFPKELLTQQVVMQPQGTAASGSTLDVSLKVVTVPALLRQDALKAALQQHGQGAKILRLRNVMQLFGGWDDDTLKGSYEVFLDKVSANWCCRVQASVDKGLKVKEKLAIRW